MNTNDNPASIPVAAALVVSTGVALASIVFGLTPQAQLATIAFGNALIGLGTALWLNARTTSNSAPVLPADTPVKVEGTTETVIVAPRS